MQRNVLSSSSFSYVVTVAVAIAVIIIQYTNLHTFSFPDTYEELIHDWIGPSIQNSVFPDCKLDHVFQVYDIKSHHHVVNSSSCYSMKDAKHTVWNLQNQSFTMKCERVSQIPMYHLGPYEFNYESYNLNWRFYPFEPIAKLLSDAGVKVESAPISMKDADIVNTVCVDLRDGYSYHDYFANVIRNETLVQERKQILDTMENKPVNIRVIVMDSTGRHFFYRHFPNTDSYLRELMSTEQSDFVVQEFNRYHIVGYNSNPNMYAFVTGDQCNSTDDFDLLVDHAANGTLPQYKKLIWDYLKQYGYVTTIGEDVHDTMTGTLYGFKNVSRTFDTYPSYNKISEIVQGFYEQEFSYKPEMCPCVGNKLMGDFIFQWSKIHLERYSDLPNFIVTVHDEAHDGLGNQCVAIDKDLKEYLQWYVESGQTNNTVIVLMADHGLHYGGHWYSEEEDMAWIEHENPLMFWFVPKHLATDTFKQNADKLVTSKDFHMTLRDVASYPHRSTTGHVRPDAKSLLYDAISSDRTCAEALIPSDHRFSCQEEENDPVNK
jgi:hypothetical protein